ncbi:FtsW/RodA/SpoVE family cell cycle protein [Fructobacillus sp. M1-13]|uniref:Probable peptidoglycan glycosyltransferase FtsW n=1 Tax=Fructobacillus papyriferae TaxID=2713171 RepID=A0ABS5QQ14_9LACO|nr:FtsW/RodA/SpoVE family cell cycle protein [Fructobacillus papyriferae]MBS9334922.1 FtsW/RodA/SpoVE family cell cycle protein [Fructobacillus papyriferae]MCD2159594.1 FtsW/RodA/SpoVE family cell cycle protein [Fructobacillus papyriferae]
MFKKLQRLDYWIAVPFAVLSLLGIVMVFSATQNAYLAPVMSFAKQAIFVFFGWSAAFFTFKINRKVLRAQPLLNALLLITTALLVVARLAPAVNGAHGWINLGPVTLQPVELAKIVLILYFAHWLTVQPWQPGKGLSGFIRSWLRPGRPAKLLWPIVILALTLAMPDMGNFFITLAVLTLLVLASGVKPRANLILVVAFFLILAFLPEIISFFDLKESSSYAIRRLSNFVDPWYNMDQSRQLLYSYYAISHGGLFGVGLGNSLIKPYLPESNTDFIMAVATEELGAVVVVVVLSLMMILIGRLVLIGIRQKSQYNRLFLYGLAGLLIMQSFVNLGGVLGLLPITGVVFPFISGGGSSFVFFSAAVGFALNIAAQNKQPARPNPQDDAARRELKH